MASRQPGGRAPALALSRRLRTPREPTGTALDRHEVKWQGRCCHKRRLEYRLMVRCVIREGYTAWPESSQELSNR